MAHGCPAWRQRRTCSRPERGCPWYRAQLSSSVASDEVRWKELFRGYREFYCLPESEEAVSRAWGRLMDPEHECRALVAGNGGRIVALGDYRRFACPSKGNVGLWLDGLFASPEARVQPQPSSPASWNWPARKGHGCADGSLPRTTRGCRPTATGAQPSPGGWLTMIRRPPDCAGPLSGAVLLLVLHQVRGSLGGHF